MIKNSFRIDLRLLALSLAAAVTLAAQSGDSPLPDAIRAGRAQFVKSCGFCHGADASGGAEGPDLMRSAIVRHDEHGNLIAAVVHEGRPGKGMPPIPLTDAQIASVAAFLHWRIKQADQTSPSRPRDYDLKLLLTGNAAQGKAFFNGAGGCARCHSPSKDLAGIAGRYSPADLQARFLYPPDIPKTATIITRSGEHFSGDLVFHDQFNIAIRNAAGWYHSWRCADVKFQIHDPVAAHLRLLYEYTDNNVHNLFAYLETLK